MVIMDIILLLFSRVVVVERMGVVGAGTYHLLRAGLFGEPCRRVMRMEYQVVFLREEKFGINSRRHGRLGGEAADARSRLTARLRPLTRSVEVKGSKKGSGSLKHLLAAACIMTSNRSCD